MTEDHRNDRERDRRAHEHDVLVTEDRPQCVREVRCLLVVQDRLHRFDRGHEHEKPHQDGDVKAAPHSVRGEEICEAHLERGARLRERDVGVPGPASRRPDDRAEYEDADVSEDRRTEGAHAQTLTFDATTPHKERGARQEHEQIGHAQTDGDRRISVDVDEELGLCDRRDAQQDDLLEQDRAREDHVEPDHWLSPDAEDDDRGGERQKDDRVASSVNDRERVRQRSQQGDRRKDERPRRRPASGEAARERGGRRCRDHFPGEEDTATISPLMRSGAAVRARAP